MPVRCHRPMDPVPSTVRCPARRSASSRWRVSPCTSATGCSRCPLGRTGRAGPSRDPTVRPDRYSWPGPAAHGTVWTDCATASRAGCCSCQTVGFRCFAMVPIRPSAEGLLERRGMMGNCFERLLMRCHRGTVTGRHPNLSQSTDGQKCRRKGITTVAYRGYGSKIKTIIIALTNAI